MHGAGLACSVRCRLQVLAGIRQRTKEEPRHPEGRVGDDRERGVVRTLRQAQQGFPKLARGVQL